MTHKLYLSTFLYSSITFGSTTITVWGLEPELCDCSRTCDINSFSRPCSLTHRVHITLLYSESTNRHSRHVWHQVVGGMPHPDEDHCYQARTRTEAYLFPFSAFQRWICMEHIKWTMLTLYWAGFFNSLCMPSSRTLGCKPRRAMSSSFIKHAQSPWHTGRPPTSSMGTVQPTTSSPPPQATQSHWGNLNQWCTCTKQSFWWTRGNISISCFFSYWQKCIPWMCIGVGQYMYTGSQLGYTTTVQCYTPSKASLHLSTTVPPTPRLWQVQLGESKCI